MPDPEPASPQSTWQRAPAPRLLLTAGPTCEDLDAVRFLTNRSTGRMGIDLAAEAHRRGWRVLLILGSTPLTPPEGIAVQRVRSAAEMHDAVLAAFPFADALVMAAAVADYTPATPVDGKLHKEEGDLLLRLVRTRDILQAVATHPARGKACVVGFSLDATLDMERAREKMARKDLDAIVVNSTRSFAGADSDALLLPRSGAPIALASGSKHDLARAILAWIEKRRSQEPPA